MRYYLGALLACTLLSSVASAQNSASPSDIQPILDAVRARQAQTALNVTTATDFQENILKYDRITLQPNSEIRFTGTGSSFYVVATRVLQIRDPQAEFRISLPRNTPSLNGQVGTPGAPGSPNHDRSDRSSGGAGGPGGSGGDGTNGSAFDRPNLYILVGDLRGDNALSNAVIQRIPAVVSARGIDGGNGGRGGNGGSGGNGQGGNQGSPGAFNCNRGPGDGGPGGAGGQGGKGGAASRGGNAADVYLVGPRSLVEAMSFWTIDTRPGAPSTAGLGGAPGTPGLGGFGGEPRGWCNGHGATGARGADPDPPTRGPGQRSDEFGRRGTIFLVDFNVGSVFP